MSFLLMLLYICVGAFVTFALYYLYIFADSDYGRGWHDKAGYCVVMGVLWPVAAPFAFALYFAKYGIPKNLKEGKKN